LEHRLSSDNGKSDDVPGGVSIPQHVTVAMDPDEEHPPGKVMELAASCVRFVVAKFKVEPDFTRDTMPMVDHYIDQARDDVKERPEAMAVIAHAAGAYIGEVARRTHACWWRIDHADPGAWRLEFRNVYLSFYPVQVAYAALTREEDSSSFAGFEMPDDDRDGLLARLAELPQVSEGEYFAPSTRLEVLDIAVDALLAKRANDPSFTRAYGPDDYAGDASAKG
jgi:hypothetical protein